MKLILAISVFMATAIAHSQEIEMPTEPKTEFQLVPAVKTTATVQGEAYIVSRDKNNKIIFVKKSEKEFAVRPMIISFDVPKEKNP